MAIRDIYSKRKARASGTAPDVFQYNDIPGPLRVQLIHILDDAFPSGLGDYYYHKIVSILRREYGVITLAANPAPKSDRLSREEFVSFLRNSTNVDKVLDGVEVSIGLLDDELREYLKSNNGSNYANSICGSAIEEFNRRAIENAVGFQYADGEILRIDSQLIHQEAVLPALIVLRGTGFESAQEEFLSAHEHYRHGRMHEALVDALKAFESVMKIICAKRGWAHSARPTASELVGVCITNGLIPAYWQTHFGGLRSVLESGIPTPRNRQGGHGAGVQPVQEPPQELISYVLHMTASTILFLSEADASLP